jgi:hypothetical protein
MLICIRLNNYFDRELIAHPKASVLGGCLCLLPSELALGLTLSSEELCLCLPLEFPFSKVRCTLFDL